MMQQNRPQIARDPELERARVWWKEHGRPITAGLVIGLVGVVGFNYWQYHRQTQAEEASVLFEQLRGAVQAAVAEAEATTEGETESETEAETDTATENTTADETQAAATDTGAETETENEIQTAIQRIAGALMADYDATPYAVHGAFALAKLSVDTGDLDQAAEALRWILDNGDEDGLTHIARLRLASVLLAKGEADAAAALLEVADTAGFAARYYELTGDAHLQTGDAAAARNAYQRSLTALPPGSSQHTLVKLKRDNAGG